MASEDITKQIQREGEEDEERQRVGFYSDSALIVGIAKLLWIYTFSLGIGALLITLGFTIRMIILWKITVYTKCLSPLDLSIVVGSDIDVISAVGLLILLVPQMIITWTTALIFDFIFDRKLHRGQAIIENGKKLAREISFTTIRNALKGGEIAGIVASVATLIGLTLLRSRIGVESSGNSGYDS